MTYGCVCDSSWEVGLGSGQRQSPEWFAADCSLSTYDRAYSCNNVYIRTFKWSYSLIVLILPLLQGIARAGTTHAQPWMKRTATKSVLRTLFTMEPSETSVM
jgi:hypothetical protein